MTFLQKMLEERTATEFYGIIHPYFDPGEYIYQNFLKGIVLFLKGAVLDRLTFLKKFVILGVIGFHLDVVKVG